MIEDGILEVRGVSLKELVVNVDDSFLPDLGPSGFDVEVKTSLSEKARLIVNDPVEGAGVQCFDEKGVPILFPEGARVATQVLYDMKVRSALGGEELKVVVNYASLYEIVYLVREEIDDPKKFHDFVQAHAPKMAWSYFRELSQSMLIRMGFNAIPGMPFVFNEG